MRGNMLVLLLIPLISSTSFAQDTDVQETTTLGSSNVSSDESSLTSTDSQLKLDSNLRNALLKALSELEGDVDDETQESEDNEKTIAKAQATAVTYFANDEKQETIAISNDQQPETKTFENQITTTIQEATKNQSDTFESQDNYSENASKEHANEVLFQKSNGIESGPITAIEREPVDFLKDAEQIITSASNSFLTQNREAVSSHTPRSIKDSDSDTLNLNTIEDLDSKTSGKAVDESSFVKTYIRPLGNLVNDDLVYVKAATNTDVNSKSSVTSEIKSIAAEKSKVDGGISEATTIAPVEVSTEENEAKVEQVQFFSAPLVAAFTVHQDEKGQPKKVEPIFKNVLNPKKEAAPVQPQKTPNLQSFNNFDLQKKQQILEQELEKLRNQQLLQQQNLLARNNLGFNNQGLTQSGFSQAIKQNFNQFDPIFTEPDRSIVTKLATIDPNTLLSQNGGPILTRFTPSEALFPSANSGFENQIMPDSKPALPNSKTKGDVSLIASISYDPIVEAGKLPLNAQVLPTREPTGFLNFVPNTQIQNSVPSLSNIGQNNQIQHIRTNSVQPSSNFVQSNFNNNSPVQPQQIPIRPSQSLAQANQNFQQPASNLIQPSISNFVGLNDQGNVHSNNFLGFNNDVRGQGINQNGFSIIRSQQPFNPTHEQGFFPNNNKFLRQNQGQNLASSNSGFQGAQNNFFNGNSHNQNRFFRSNLEGSVGSNNNFNIQQGVQPFEQQNFNNNLQDNRFFRSNREGSFNAAQNFGNQQNLGFQTSIDQSNRFLRSNQESTFLSNLNRFAVQPKIQNYKYSNSFGFPTIPLNKK